jgi:molybdate-binding protein/DNA-binding transcriptional regulator YhcF (GntR family)
MPGPPSFVYLDIAEAVRRLILSGELGEGERLPSVREMAVRWRCTPNTVSRAYAKLIDEGLVTAHRGGGTRVASSTAGFGEARPPEWEWAELVNRAEAYLLEALKGGHSAAHAEAALAAAIGRWEEMRRRPSPGGSSLHAKGAVLGIASDSPPESAAGAGEESAVGAGAKAAAKASPKASAKAAGAAISSKLHFSGSHDLSVELLGRSLSEQTPAVELTTEFIGSLGGLMALARGEADLAGSHLWDEETRTYNVAFVQHVLPNRQMVLLSLVERVQGLIVPEGNPAGLSSLADLGKPGVVFVNRQPGSGTRVWLDIMLKAAGVDVESVAGYAEEEATHLGVARAVAEGRATGGLGISAAATAYGLGFVPVGRERYDLVIPLENWDLPPLLTLRSVVASQSFRDAVTALGGYDTSNTGREIRLG